MHAGHWLSSGRSQAVQQEQPSTAVLTLVEAVVVHASVHVQVLPGHQGELCLGVLVGAIVGVVAAATRSPFTHSSITAAAASWRHSPVPGRAQAHLAGVARSGARRRAGCILHLNAAEASHLLEKLQTSTTAQRWAEPPGVRRGSGGRGLFPGGGGVGTQRRHDDHAFIVWKSSRDVQSRTITCLVDLSWLPGHTFLGPVLWGRSSAVPRASVSRSAHGSSRRGRGQAQQEHHWLAPTA